MNLSPAATVACPKLINILSSVFYLMSSVLLIFQPLLLPFLILLPFSIKRCTLYSDHFSPTPLRSFNQFNRLPIDMQSGGELWLNWRVNEYRGSQRYTSVRVKAFWSLLLICRRQLTKRWEIDQAAMHYLPWHWRMEELNEQQRQKCFHSVNCVHLGRSL